MAYIPSQDALILSWAQNFSDLLTADPPRYGLTAPDALIVKTQQDIFAAAYALATSPSTRTEVTVADKDGEKVTLLILVRKYAAIIRANLGVANEDKTALGLNIPDLVKTPVPTPVTYPMISVLFAASGIHQLFIADQNTPDTKAKPYGVSGCLLYQKSGVTAPVDMDDALLTAIITRADTALNVSATPAGHHISYRGAWFNSKGEIGPVGPTTDFIRA